MSTGCVYMYAVSAVPIGKAKRNTSCKLSQKTVHLQHISSRAWLAQDNTMAVILAQYTIL